MRMQHSQKKLKTIAQAILNEKPEFRYVVGSDAVTLLEARKICPIENFKTRSGNNLICRILAHKWYFTFQNCVC